MIYHELVSQTNVNADLIDHAIRLLHVTHNMERFADRVTNICERTVFTATGEMMEISTSGD